MFTLVTILILCYLLIVIFVFFYQRSLLYHPSENNYTSEKANFNYEGLSTKYLFNNDSILVELIKSELLKNPNLNININLNVKDIINIDELNSLFLKLEIESGDIKISDSYVMWKDDLMVNLNESLINYDQGEIFLTGRINVEIKDIDNFYRSYQINKADRKLFSSINKLSENK